MVAIQEKKIGKHTIKVFNDNDPIDPRGNDNLGTMVCFHNRFSLGDNHNFNQDDYSGWESFEKHLRKEYNIGVILPLYLYNHSGITMNTTGFSCPWDSGQVGFIYITKEKMIEEYGGKYVTKSLIERVSGYLVSEVSEYDQYLTGDVYGFQIFDEGEDEVESCWGIYGDDECMTEAESVVKQLTE